MTWGVNAIQDVWQDMSLRSRRVTSPEPMGYDVRARAAHEVGICQCRSPNERNLPRCLRNRIPNPFIYRVDFKPERSSVVPLQHAELWLAKLVVVSQSRTRLRQPALAPMHASLRPSQPMMIPRRSKNSRISWCSTGGSGVGFGELGGLATAELTANKARQREQYRMPFVIYALHMK